MKKIKLAMLCFVSCLVIVGCASQPKEEKPTEMVSLSIGVMPAVDSAPIFLAQERGYFTELGLDLDVQVYTNAMNRQSALQSGGLDGAMTDVIALVNNVQNGFNIKVTASTDGTFPVMINKDSVDKKEVKVGLMEVSVVNYLADRYLSDYTVEKVYINEIPARLEMVSTGQLDMAVLPEPVASQGELNGLVKQIMTSDDAFSPDVMVFTDQAIAENYEAIEMFHEAYNKAVNDINADDSDARDLLISKLDLNPDIRDLIVIPEYHIARVPSEAFLKDVMTWNKDVLGVEIDLRYDDLVDARFTQ